MSKDYVEIDGKKIRVYQICESDAVAAEWDTDAVKWYKNLTGLTDDKLYALEDVEIVDPETKVYANEDSEEIITVREIVEAHWIGDPFIAVSEIY